MLKNIPISLSLAGIFLLNKLDEYSLIIKYSLFINYIFAYCKLLLIRTNFEVPQEFVLQRFHCAVQKVMYAKLTTE